MQASKKFTAYGLVLGALMAATALAPAANAADLNVRVLLPDGQYVSLGDNPSNRWYNRPEYQQYGFSKYRYNAHKHAYVAYDPHGNYAGHNSHGGGWHGGQGGHGGPGGNHGGDQGHDHR